MNVGYEEDDSADFTKQQDDNAHDTNKEDGPADFTKQQDDNAHKTNKSKRPMESSLASMETGYDCFYALEEVYLLQQRNALMKEKLNKARAKNALMREKINKARTEKTTHLQGGATNETFSAEMDRPKALESQLSAEIKLQVQMHNEQKSALKQAQLDLQKAEQDLECAKVRRRNLHNQLQDLKGTIRVFVRLCPLLKGELGDAFQPVEGDDSIIRFKHPLKSITIDKVFRDNASQSEIFTEVSQLLQSAIDGQKVCIFAYGQSGSGKTHTMMGEPKKGDEMAGIIPRTVEFVLNNIQDTGCKIKISAFELYNSTVHDLFVKNGGAGKCKVQHPNDLTVIHATDVEEVLRLLRQATKYRSTGETKLNKTSSRSHCIFHLGIYGANDEAIGVINLIDLAGSENYDENATREMKDESKHINESLHWLRLCLNSIANKERHIKYKSSALTSLLEPYLRGDSKTIMIVNVSQEASKTKESMRSLKFAESVKSCHLKEVFSPLSSWKSGGRVVLFISRDPFLSRVCLLLPRTVFRVQILNMDML
ncbi:kinesin-like protein KIN-14N isoform X2 [Phragmites australis]|uniref:kinesin-like protein KIN-14N isoform X2 n=1 Tax=Phragmites australis TaxID=29695 RepID=UPI002D77E5E7|nr:kinesin-like protein KIN-14N isoform X2 [Phragmites australis]XP_062179066.1 kinesin-like protein KIN-14N isoform X2 [Phragmites australis]